MVADVALHLDNEKNPHAHVMLTTRGISPDGFGQKRRDWNDRTELLEWREGWANLANQHLAQAGHDIRIDHRTLEAQGIDLLHSAMRSALDFATRYWRTVGCRRSSKEPSSMSPAREI
jgi:ATP-dependent exoDNAse (exonuclease V) alpha subunit